MKRTGPFDNRMVWPRVELRPGSRPARALPVIDPDRTNREVYCARYENCLDYACGEGWENFTCLGCTVDETISPQQIRSDMEHLAALLREVAGPKAIRLRNGSYWMRPKVAK